MTSYTCPLTAGHAGSTSFISHVLPLTSLCCKMRLQTCIKVKTQINQSQFQIYHKKNVYIYIISSLVEEAWYHQFLYDSLILSEYCLLFLEGFLATNIKISDVSCLIKTIKKTLASLLKTFKRNVLENINIELMKLYWAADFIWCWVKGGIISNPLFAYTGLKCRL